MNTNQLIIGGALTVAILAIVLSVLLAPPSGPKIVTLQALKPAETVPVATTPEEASTPTENTAPVYESTPLEPSQAVEQTNPPTQSTIRELPVQDAGTLPEQPTAPIVETSTPTLETTPSTATATAPVVTPNPTVANDLPVRTTNELEVRDRRAPRVAQTPSAAATARPSLPLRRNPRDVSVQAGAFKSQENAQKLANRLLSAGIKARTEFGDGFYRVIVGPYADEARAKAAARGIATLMR